MAPEDAAAEDSGAAAAEPAAPEEPAEPPTRTLDQYLNQAYVLLDTEQQAD